MKLFLAIVVAYVVTAIFFVRRDLTESDQMKVVPFIRTYRRSGGITNLVLAGIGWLPATLIAAYWKPRPIEMGREGRMIALFLFAIFVFSWLISN